MTTLMLTRLKTLQLIHETCLECTNQSKQEITDCKVISCHLYLHRNLYVDLQRKTNPNK